jgi:hypothetical protein
MLLSWVEISSKYEISISSYFSKICHNYLNQLFLNTSSKTFKYLQHVCLIREAKRISYHGIILHVYMDIVGSWDRRSRDLGPISLLLRQSNQICLHTVVWLKMLSCQIWPIKSDLFRSEDRLKFDAFTLAPQGNFLLQVKQQINICSWQVQLNPTCICDQGI